MKKKVIVWGTGHYYKLVIDYLKEIENTFSDLSFEIKALIDSDICKQNKILNGVMIYSPDYLKPDEKKALIIVAIRRADEIKKTLNNKGFKYCLTAEELLLKETLLLSLLTNNRSNIIDCNSSIIKRGNNRLLLKALKTNDILNPSDVYSVSAAIGEFVEDTESYNVSISKEKGNFENKGKVGIYYGRLYNGGVERVISVLIPILIKAGYEIVLFTNEVSDQDYYIPECVERCVIPFDSYMPYIWLEKFYIELISKKISVLINHAHATYRSYYLGICVKMLGIKYIVESHTCVPAIKKNIAFYKNNYLLADKLVVLSNRDYEYWSAEGISAIYVPNPVTYEARVNTESYNDNEILWVGRIDDIEKNVYEIVPIAKNVIAKIPTAKFNIVGREDDKCVLNELKRRIKENGLKNNIKLCGYTEDVGKYFNTAAVFFMTSPYEGFPMSLVESKSYGVPAVIYEIEGLELTQDGLGVVKVPQGNTNEMAEVIINILNNKRKREKLSREAKESIEKFAQIDLTSLWRDVIEE